MVWVFWVSAVLVVYHYGVFPLLVGIIARLRPRPVTRGDFAPSVSLIISAYNEEKVIEGKLQNTLALDYPREKLQTLVMSDGSTDSTPALVEAYRGKGIESRHLPQRRGKTAAMNRAVGETVGEILLFSDANTLYNREAVRALVQNFQDPRVGAVSGVKAVIAQADRQSSRGEGLYWRYESWLKKQESRAGSIATGDGEIFAVRKSLFRPQAEKTIHDDLGLSLEVIRQGYRVVYERGARSLEPASKSLKDEFFIKVRMAAGGFQMLQRFWLLLLPPRNLFTWQFLSHKIMRWLLFVPLLLLLISSASPGHPILRTVFGLQVLFYGAAAIGLLLWVGKKEVGPFYLPFYFCLVNAACLVGLLQFLTGRHTSSWRKAER